eukprot:Amastigsp_a516236_14.p2 type:complete len:109 gc:universal Amastigsp_a516236_14:21-347(+)
MVCKKCEAKQTKVAAAEVWREDAGAPAEEASSAKAQRASKMSRNKLLSKRPAAAAASPLGVGGQCRSCHARTLNPDARYCAACAYRKGKCELCGKTILDGIEQYKMKT